MIWPGHQPEQSRPQPDVCNSPFGFMLWSQVSKGSRNWGLVSSVRIDMGVFFSLGNCASSPPLCVWLWSPVVTAPTCRELVPCPLQWPCCRMCSRVRSKWGWRSGPPHSLAWTCFRSVLVEDVTVMSTPAQEQSLGIYRAEACCPQCWRSLSSTPQASALRSTRHVVALRSTVQLNCPGSWVPFKGWLSLHEN